MGEIAEMMLDGTLCECCGEYMDGESGYPRRCAACAADTPQAATLKTYPNAIAKDKAACPTCGKRVKKAGLSNHIRDAHGVTL